MAKRHKIVPHDWDSVFRRLDELCHANSISDSFWPILKLVFCIALETKRNFSVAESPRTLEAKEQFNAVLMAIEKEWPKTFPYEPNDLGMSESLLVLCLKELEGITLDFNNLEFMDALFESLMLRSSKGEKGQFFTPRHVVDFCVEVLAPSADQHVADIACGSGAFLVSALQRDARNLKTTNTNVWGFDIDLKAIAVARLNLIALGKDPNHIVFADSLKKGNKQSDILGAENLTIERLMANRQGLFQGFDVIITNPPFAGDVMDASLLNDYELYKKGRRNERDVMFIERCIELLKPGGALAIIVPTNKLGAKKFEYVRNFLLTNLRVFGITSLPREIFAPHTVQKTEIIFAIKRQRPVVKIPESESILFAISEKSGKSSTGQPQFKDHANADAADLKLLDHDLYDAIPNLILSKNVAIADSGTRD